MEPEQEHEQEHEQEQFGWFDRIFWFVFGFLAVVAILFVIWAHFTHL